MKVILKQDVHNLGKAGELVNVNDGYAKNFLLPKGMAMEASATAVNEMKMRQNAEKSKKENELANAKKLQDKMSGLSITFVSKSGENGKLFGSITSKDISEKLKKEHKITVDKRKINLPEAIKTLGTHEIEIKLHSGVSTTLKIVVTGES